MTLEMTESQQVRAAATRRVLALINDKGGVGKTTLAANIAGQLAAADYNVLLIDLNRQANLSDDLGYRDRAGVDDQGAKLLTSIMMGTPLEPVVGVRPNLSIVPGGVRLADLTPLLLSRFQTSGRSAFLALGDAIAPIAHQYDLIVIDSPPENTILVDLALGAARWVLMPTRSDGGGLIGMQLVAERFTLAREINPSVGLLGVVLFGTLSSATAIHAEVRADVSAAFGGTSPMLEATVRYSERYAREGRKKGRLAHELEVDAANQPAWWQSLRDGGGPSSRRLPAGVVASVSADFRQVAAEVLDALASREAR
jgi:chromosome partitioning protein